jgi:catechol 2,3-dioxygenase-like lactoylglutathione lyase family enzyme
MSPAPGGGAAVPCLRVSNAETAASYYREVLGFEVVALLGGHPPGFAIVRRQGATLLLQQVPADVTDAGPRRDPAGPPWDAVLLVGDVEAAHRDLQLRGASGLGDINGRGIGWDSFDVQDCCGNLICIGHASDLFLKRTQQSRQSPVTQWRGRWQRIRSAREEREQAKEFQQFYENLEDKRDVFYMFFTSGLLHWVVHAESFVPRDTNLVLIGSALTSEECEWIVRNLDRPFHHIRMPVDDVTAWEFLFAHNRNNFGWVDIDCFVLNGGLFKEMTALDQSVSMNCTWSWDSGYGFRLANTHFLFVNTEAIRAVEAAGVPASPTTYDWMGSPRGFPLRKCFMKVPTDRQRALLLKILPADAEGRPQLIEGDYYNTLLVYQMLARVVGYPISQARDLVRRCGIPVNADSTDPEHWPEDMSPELFHLFGVSYSKNYDSEPGIRALYLAAEYAMLEDTAARLPPQYSEHLEEVSTDLTHAGLPPDTARERFRQHLIAARRLDAGTADQILRVPPVRS